MYLSECLAGDDIELRPHIEPLGENVAITIRYVYLKVRAIYSS